MLEVVAATLASVLFNISPVMQSIDAQSSSMSLRFRPALLLHLMRHPMWLAGSFAGATAVGLEMYALTRLPLSFVQPLLAGGVLVMPLAAKVLLDERLSLRWFVASIVIVAGVILLGLSLPAVTDRVHTPSEPVLILITLAALPLYLALKEVRNPGLLALAAGGLYGASAIFLKVLAISFSLERVVALAPVLAGLAIVGFIAEMSALQNSPATSVVPPILALTTVLPVLVGHIVLGESWPHPEWTLLGFALTVIPALWIAAHFSLASEIRSGRPRPAGSGSQGAPRPAPP